MYLKEQAPLESLHEFAESFPELLDQVITPVGEVPTTFALHVVGRPTVEGWQLTWTLVDETTAIGVPWRAETGMLPQTLCEAAPVMASTHVEPAK